MPSTLSVLSFPSAFALLSFLSIESTRFSILTTPYSRTEDGGDPVRSSMPSPVSFYRGGPSLGGSLRLGEALTVGFDGLRIGDLQNKLFSLIACNSFIIAIASFG